MSRLIQKLLVVALVYAMVASQLGAHADRPPANAVAPPLPGVIPVAIPKESGPPRLMPTAGAVVKTSTAALANDDWAYDPTSMYDQKGVNVPRGFSAEAPNELIDPFSGNLMLYYTDLHLPGVAGLDLTLQRVYNSKIHRNYAARATGDPIRVSNGMNFLAPSPLGLGWTMHLGRLVGANQTGPNNALPFPRYYERSDGSQHPFFTYTGPGCGDEINDVCYFTKQKDNPYWGQDDTWHVSTADGLKITFDHAASYGGVVFHYATEIRDAHGNHIQIFYHDDTIYDFPYQREDYRHFIDFIIDSANRRISFNYSEVNPGVVRLTSITAVGRTYTYGYSSENPSWAIRRAFLTRAQPPEGAPWLYDYAGLYNGDCIANHKRWCELTQITYPNGGTIAYTFGDHIFWAQSNRMSVRAVATRQVAGRQVTPATWTYTYNRDADYTGDEHTVITRPAPDSSQEIFTYFGVGNGPYNPWGLAWKAGVLLQKRLRAADGTIVQTETFDWEPSPAISDEFWGDPWIGFDSGVFVARVRQKVTQRGNLTWTVTHTSFNNANNLPRCTTEQGDGGATRYRLRRYEIISTYVQNDLFRFRYLPWLDLLSYDAPSPINCDDQQSAPIYYTGADELDVREYSDLGQLTTRETNGVYTDYRYNSDGTLQAEILYQGRDPISGPTDGFCTTFSNYIYGVPRQIGFGAPAPNCSAPIYSVNRTVNSDGSLASITNGRGHTTEFDYDDLGRVIEIRPPGEDPIGVTYDGSPTSFSTTRRVTQGVFWLESRFDGLGREIEKENSAGVHAWQSYDALGRINFQSLPSYDADNTAGDTFTYDPLGRIESVTHVDDSSIGYIYGTDVYSITITDEENRQTVHTRRAFGDPDDYWLMRVQLPGDPEPTQDTYTYLVGGHLTGVNYAGQSRTIGYNFAKQVVREDTPERGSVYWGYDAAGNLRCHDLSAYSGCSDDDWDNPRADIRYTVDSLGRVTLIEYESPDMADVTFTYDKAGNLETMTDGVGTHSFDYAPTDRLQQRISTIGGVEYTTSYTYDNRGNLETMTYPSGRVVTYDYDVGNRVTSVGGFVDNIEYHATGLASRIKYDNGVATTLTLDARQRPDVLSASGVLKLSYDYDGVGNVARLLDGINHNNDTSFSYDNLDRLVDASGPWGSLHYEYNAAGDRTLERLDGQDTIYTYDSSGQLENLSGRINLDYTFDDWGRIYQRGAFRYAYDLEDRITEVTGDQSNPIVTYGYDGQGQRVVETHSGCGNSLIYHYDQQGNRIAESTDQGLMLKEYIVAADCTVAELDLNPLTVSPTELDFGDVEVGSSITRTITLTNRATQPLTVDNLSVLGQDFSTTSNLPLVIAANSVVSVPVGFTTQKRSHREGALTVCADSGIELSVALRGRAIPVPQAPGTTVGISTASDGTQGNSHSYVPSISADGRYVTFSSSASNLVTGDTNDTDVFVYDSRTGETTRVSVASSGLQGNNVSGWASISADGRYVAFDSWASNLVSGDTNGRRDVYVRDRQARQTTRVSVASDGTQGNLDSHLGSISADGRYVAFSSRASSLVTEDTNAASDVFVRDLQTGQTTRVSVASDGTEGDHNSLDPSISADGRYVAFWSAASNLVGGDTDLWASDIFVHDRQTGQTTRVSVASDGTEGNQDCWNPSISADGRYVAFESLSDTLVSDDSNDESDVFVHDRQTGQTTRVSIASDGTQANGLSGAYGFGQTISADGRYMAFHSLASNLVSGDTNNVADVFVHDRQTGQTTRVSIASDGTQANGGSGLIGNGLVGVTISADGRFVAFASEASNLVSGDSNNSIDIFVRYRSVPEACSADVDGSGLVDIVDILAVAARWRTSQANPDPDGDPSTPNYEARYDLDHDGDIDIVDIMLVVKHWGNTCG